MTTTNAPLHAMSAGQWERLGLKVESYFTTPGIHPYDELEWELRDAVIKDWKTGRIAFEQRDVEFPKSWSLNATTIVAQKYFRGHLGTPGREHSVRQMIDRVADTITAWGRKDGYFADTESADAFNTDLKHLLVHQKAAFNSPVWFNVGVDGRPPQCSACFILSVEDTMGSILNWYVEEGTIFKGGSGSGVNLSRIRSSVESLAGGGAASGPVSFMRGADASAGTIKSGGTTRRAAKMVILNVDHPDIEEFIWCKQREELKARALREAGFDMDLDGRDFASIQYQNANNSVRVTDEFMQALLDDKEFMLRTVTTSEPVKTVRARDLMRQIAQAAWECADPGMQYDTTINDWHTTPNAGRINGSNPCSEYMHLDNSACNLASLNLRKFEADSIFDVEAFRRAVEIMFTAQEIIVGNSSYPTEKIAANAKAYRQLGLGYANLGGLLMSLGLAYDSDEGRAWAAAITALMTGHAYRISAEIARVAGPFEGYAKDRDGMLRVLRKHRAAVEDIDVRLAPANVLSAARQAWDDAVTLGTEYGVRNAQASVLAPTGCLVGGSLIATDRGLIRIGSLGDPDGSQWQDLDLRVATDEGPKSATQFYVNGFASVVTITTSCGYRIQGTPTHQIKVATGEGRWEWRRFAELGEGDAVPLLLDQLVGGPQRVGLMDAYGAGEDRVRTRRAMTPDLAELLGYYMGNGSLDAHGMRLCVVEGDFDVVDRLVRLGKELFSLEAHVADRVGSTEVAFHSAFLAEWWEACGFAEHELCIPDAVLHTNDRTVYAAFLRGLFEADGTVAAGCPRWATSSMAFSHDVQSLLLALGYPATREMGTTESGRPDLAVLRLLDPSSHAAWLDEIGFLSDRKNAAVQITDSQQPARNGEECGRALRFFYDTVVTAHLGDEDLTYDISVPENVTYVANGFVSHNTIGLMMDCDTTGIEPDLGLVKSKKLVGGGTMRIINQTVPVALQRLGYPPEQIEAIVAYIDEHATIEGAPAFKPEHLPVFDCAMGERSIPAMGHVTMMAAVQPFISGALSKCVVGETLLTTGDGLVRIGSLHRGEKPDSFRDEILEIASLGGPIKTDAFYYGGLRPVRKVVLRSGHTVTGTGNHRVLVASEGRGLIWRSLDELQSGEHVATQYGSNLWSALPARFDDFHPGPRPPSHAAVEIPTEMTVGLAFLLGAYAAGWCTEDNRIVVTDSQPAVRHRVASTWRSVFRIEPGSAQPDSSSPQIFAHFKVIREFFEYLGCGRHPSHMRIPDAILRSPRDMVLAFLQGLTLDADVARIGQTPTWVVCLDSSGLADDLQAVLTNLGVVHNRIFDEVRVAGAQARRLTQLVPFMEPAKATRARDLLLTASAQRTADVVPGISFHELHGLIPRGDTRTPHVSWEMLDRVSEIPGVELPEWLQRVLVDNLHFSKVESVTDDGEREVFDISVPTTHSFVGNGVVNHNTVNLPESATVEDLEHLYLEGWRRGLKALAIYRDNCKVAQPLSLAAKKETPNTTEHAAAKAGMVRRRLPKQRPSQTISFQVGDAEGYLTAGEYPGDGLGEIFVKLGKQGSTLSGVMDAFAISVSIGLQYGVPLEVYVRKFTNMRFEPAGMTDDPEVRFATSIVDYLFRRLAIEYLPADRRQALGIYTIEERAALEAGSPTPAPQLWPPSLADAAGQTIPPADRPTPVDDTHGDAPMCYQCGVAMIRAGSCHCCPQCGTTSGCS